MRITLEDLLTPDFDEKFRGFDVDEVNEYTDAVKAILPELQAAAAQANERASRAEAELAQLRAAKSEAETFGSDPVASPRAAVSETEMAQEATRTLVMAQRTADATIIEAREEAERLLQEAETARSEALTAGATEAEQLVAEAREKATEEFESARSTSLDELDALAGEKATAVGELKAITERVEHYRDALEQVTKSIRTILDNPDALAAPEPLDVDLSIPPPRARFDTSAAREPDARYSPDPSGSRGSFVDDAPTSEAFGHAEDVHFASSDFEAAPPPPPAPPAEFSAAPDPFGATSSGEPGMEPPPPPADETWAPGSWSQLAERDQQSSPAPQDPQPGSAFGSADGFEFVKMPDAAFDGPPTEVHNSGSDPFMADLDAAVNAEASSDDADAISAFFDGDDPAPPSRFGRRR